MKTIISYILAAVYAVVLIMGKYLEHSAQIQAFRFKTFPKSSGIALIFFATLMHYWDFHYTLFLIVMVIDFTAYLIFYSYIETVVDDLNKE
mgnify:CR=1 FL=1